MLALSRNIFIRTFHWWSISCHSSVQPVPGGGPTIDLHNFRKWVSRRSRCRLYIVRCPPAKHATDDTTDSKYRKRFTVSEWVRPACQSRQPFQGAGKHNKLNLHFTFIRCQWTKENHRISSSKKKCSGHVLASFQFACACRSAESSNPTCKQAVQLVERFLGTNSLHAQPSAPLAS